MNETKTDFLKLLAALEENPDERTKPIASAIRRVLGRQEPETAPPSSFHSQLHVPKEYPQYRVKFDAKGNEIARRRCENLAELEQLFRSEKDMLWQQSIAVPIDPNEEAGR